MKIIPTAPLSAYTSTISSSLRHGCLLPSKSNAINGNISPFHTTKRYTFTPRTVRFPLLIPGIPTDTITGKNQGL